MDLKKYEGFQLEVLESVLEFHKVFGLAVNEQITPKLFYLRASLITEELNELTIALGKDDKVGILDAFCDLIYVFAGAYVSVEPIKKMEKFDLDYEMYQHAMEHPPELYISNVHGNCSEFIHDLLVPTLRMFISRRLQFLFVSALVFDLPLIEGFRLVHENNMTKLGPDGKPIINEYGKIIKPDTYKPVDLSVLF